MAQGLLKSVSRHTETSIKTESIVFLEHDHLWTRGCSWLDQGLLKPIQWPMACSSLTLSLLKTGCKNAAFLFFPSLVHVRLKVWWRRVQELLNDDSKFVIQLSKPCSSLAQDLLRTPSTMAQGLFKSGARFAKALLKNDLLRTRLTRAHGLLKSGSMLALNTINCGWLLLMSDSRLAQVLLKTLNSIVQSLF